MNNIMSENAKLIAEKRYLKIDKDGDPVETIPEMFMRISKFIIKGENDLSDKKDGYKPKNINELKDIVKKFYDIQNNLEFLSGMVMLDRGKEDLVAACYVMPIHDNLESIYGTLAQTVTLHRRGAGIGYDFSEIRPSGEVVHTTGKKATGPISFMRLYDFSSEVIMNKGSVRHAGHMGILRIDHPDIEKFITAKKDYTQLTNFNLSIAITDDFIKAYKSNKTYELRHNNVVFKSIGARDILKQIAQSIYQSGEPGFIFIDEINRHNPTIHIGKITATNQCGEQPLLPYEACNLGSVVLNKFLIADSLSQNIPDNQKINWVRLAEVVRLGIRFLDDTITVSKHLLPEIKQIVKFGNRKVGLGVMGWADLLYELNIPYDSKEALILAEKIMSFINDNAREESEVLGREKGSFGNFKGSIWDKHGHKYMRNATVTTIAPNGTTSLLADCNGGIEPFFALGYSRKNMETIGNTELFYINEILERKLKKEWLYEKELMEKIVKSGSIQDIDKIPSRVKRVFVGSLDIDPKWHLMMQSAFQKYTDNAVSKTINFKENISVNDIINAFELACDLNLKGMTIYRDKSRNLQVLNLNK